MSMKKQIPVVGAIYISPYYVFILVNKTMIYLI